jgi:tetratricopeptide (TPR) repeat protein
MFTKSEGVCGLVLLFNMVALFCSPVFSQTSRPTPGTPANEISLQVIVVRSQDEAQDVLNRLGKGEDFSLLAKEKSIDPTAMSGGFMGKFAPRSLRTELRDALKGVSSGQITPIVHIPSGYAILKVMKQDAAASPPADPARNFALAATGTVKYALDVGGLSEAEAAILKFAKGSDWNSTPQKVCETRKQSLSDMIFRLEDLLSPQYKQELAARPPIDGMQLHYGVAQLYAYQGKMEPAIKEYEAAYEVAQRDMQSAIPQMEETLGIIYLHKSEMENEAYRKPGKKCLFPMKPEDAYKDPSDSVKAIEHFEKYLEAKPNELEVIWLLNVAYMTVGKYPTGVPKEFLLPPSTFESKESVGRFEDIANQVGLNSFSTAGGVIVDDFENNGLLDVVTSGFESCAPMHYFHNNGDGTFTEKTGLDDQVGGLNMMQTDFDNDGCLDILVMRGGWEFPQRKSLLKGHCNGTFTDVTVQAGLAKPTSSQAAVWTDINNDGLLDLFVGNETGPAQLFLNKGDGTFEDISYPSGVVGDGSAFSKGVAAADYDNDGYVDLYVSNLNGDNFLYHNEHDNTFTEIALPVGAPGSRRGFTTWFFDYDNDGLPDIFATSYFTSVEETIRTYLNLPHNAATLKLYKNLGNGKFRDVTTEAGLDKVFMPMGSNFGDIDNDGYLDIYMGTGNPSYASIVPNVLLHNHEGKYFEDVTFSSGTGEIHKGHAVAFADLSRNGNEEIVTAIGGATLGDAHALRLFHNPGHGNDWINLKLVGVKTNRVAIGARIEITVQDEGQPPRSIWRTVGSGGSFGSSPLEQHIGLGKSAKILDLEVFWPVSKTHQVFHNVAKNQFLEIKEFSETYAKLDRKPVHLGGPQSQAAASAKSGPAGAN